MESNDDDSGDPNTLPNRKAFSQPLFPPSSSSSSSSSSLSSSSATTALSRSSHRPNLSLDGTLDPLTSGACAYAFASPPPPSYHHQHSPSLEAAFPVPIPPSNMSAAPSFVTRRPASSSSFASCDSTGSLTLDAAMSEFGGAPGTLPEFTGSGGGTGIFRVPVRAAVHPNRPPALELRPHPLRETQYGAFLRKIACTETQLWAGLESGVRYWRFLDMYEKNVGGKRGDEESAPFKEFVGKMSPTLCLVLDPATTAVWTGHKDGKIRSWTVEGEGEEEEKEQGELEEKGVHFKEGLAWQAYRTPVLSMVMSSAGKV